MSSHNSGASRNGDILIMGGLPPKPTAQPNHFRRRKPYVDTKGERGNQTMVSTYPLLRRILQSRKLLSDSINLRPQHEGFPVEVTNPSLKYELLEYLVMEDNEAQAMNEGRDRGGRGRIPHGSDQAFNELSLVILSKSDAPPSSQDQVTTHIPPQDEWSRLKNQSIKTLGAKRIAFKICGFHKEEQVMYDRLAKQLLCCRCLAVKQLKPDCNINEIIMADDYCLQWSVKWRQLSSQVSQLKELLHNRASINGLLYAQIQNFMVRETLQARFKHQEGTAPLLIAEFAQRIYESEQLVLGYESAGAADEVHEMELTYHLFNEDLRRLERLTRNTDLLHENRIIESVSRLLLSQLDDEAPPLTTLANLSSSPEPEFTRETDRSSRSASKAKPPVGILSTGKTSTQKRMPSESKSFHRSAQSSVSFKEQDDSFWESSSKDKKPGTPMVELLHSLSSLRCQLLQTCALSETLKEAAVAAEYKGDAMKALELLSETHTTVVKIRSLESRIQETKRAILKKQQEKADAQKAAASQPRSSSTSFKRTSSQTRPFKYLKGVL